MKKPDIVVKPCGVFPRSKKHWGYEIVRVPSKEARKELCTARGDAYSRRMFHSNQYGKFLFGYRIQVIQK
jgi:hypothetical protein